MTRLTRSSAPGDLGSPGAGSRSSYPARERPEDFPGVDGRLVAGAAAEAAGGRTVAWLPRFEDARAFLAWALRPGDVCLAMGAGNIDELARSLVHRAPGTSRPSG